MLYSALSNVLRTRSFWLATLLFMSLYLLLQAYILNHTLINQTLSGTFSITYKATLLYYLSTGYLQSLPTFYLGMTLLTMLLVGMNLSLVLLNYLKARRMGGMKVTLGGSSLLAVVSSGCPGCGITALSILGPSTSAFSFLFADVRIQMVVLGILGVSIYYNLKKLTMPQACALPTREVVRTR